MKRTCRNRKRYKKSTQRKRRVLRAGAWFTGQSSTLDILNGMDDEQIGILGRDMEEIAGETGINVFNWNGSKTAITRMYSKKCHEPTFPENYCNPFKTLVAAIASPAYYNYEENRESILASIIVQAKLYEADKEERLGRLKKGRIISNRNHNRIAKNIRYEANRIKLKYGPPPSRPSTWF
jgi:hypothetical protein